jgi:hypothetical protein
MSALFSLLLGLPVTYRSPAFVWIAAPPWTSWWTTWDSASTTVVALGARRLGEEHVYADPAGHPFCLVPRPVWAPPIHQHPSGPDGGLA